MQLFAIKIYPTGLGTKSPAPLPGALHMSPREFLKLSSPQVRYTPMRRVPTNGGGCGDLNAETPSFHNQQEEIR